MLPKTVSSHHGSRETPHEVLPGLPVLSRLLTERPPQTGIHVGGGVGVFGLASVGIIHLNCWTVMRSPSEAARWLPQVGL